MRALRSATLALTFAFVVATGAASAQNAAVEDARASYHRGRTLFDQQRYAEALEAFRASVATLPSPNTQLYIARSLRELRRTTEAYRAFDLAARAADARRNIEPRYNETYVSATTERDALASRVGFVRLAFATPPSPGTSVEFDGEPYDRSEWEQPRITDAGRVEVTVRTEGMRPFRQVIDVPPGGTTRIEIPAPTPIANAPTVSRVELTTLGRVGIVVGVVGVASLAAGVVMGALDFHQYSTLLDACMPPCTPMYYSDIATGEHYQVAANALFVTAGALSVIGAALTTIDLVTHRRTDRAVGAAVVPGGVLVRF
jgi:hypothetical protein